jgi:2-polyprenyl-6-methoxyphenol hydroxylase-like FAD-dependent oxidoreductase
MTQRDQADVHADVIVIGGGVTGLSAGMLLARDGHRVRVLERDPAPPPAPPAASWHAWERRGVNQFHMLHSFLARWRQTIEAELPEVAAAMHAAGAVRINSVADAPDALTGGWWPGDERFDVLTARRPVTEAVLASVAAATPGLVVERGVGVRSLVADAGPSAIPGRPHVTGVVTEDGRRLTADLVVDAGGRRSPRPRWLAEIGAPPGVEHVADSGFVYYCRHFRSGDGSMPPAFGPPLQPYGSVSLLALPADNGTWGIGIVASAADRTLRALRDEDTWTRVVKHYPLLAHWLDGEPISGVDVIAKIEDRQRHDWHDGAPCATGIVAIGDAWAATNPSVGRGASIGIMHAVALRDVLRATPPDGDPAALARAFDAATAATVAPYVEDTLAFDRHRLAEIEATIAGVPYETDDPGWHRIEALRIGAMRDPALLRAYCAVRLVLARVDEVWDEPGVAERASRLGDPDPAPGPDREELVAIVAG